MGDAPNTSFIPKQAIGRGQGGRPRKRRNRFSVLSFIALVLFLGSMILAVGVFVYEDTIERQLTQRKEELADLRNSFSPGDIASIRELDFRLRAATWLLDNHSSPSRIFDLLEQITQREAQFDSFAYNRRESGDAALSLSGFTFRFNTVALQSRQFDDNSMLADAIFSGLSISTPDPDSENVVDTRDQVTFSTEVNIEQQAIAYTAVPQDTQTNQQDSFNTVFNDSALSGSTTGDGIVVENGSTTKESNLSDEN